MVLNMPLQFPSGSINDAEICANVTVIPDNMVECDEDFSLELTLLTAKDGLSLGNDATSVVLLDSDGM